jgi:hypothetical protein
MKKIITSIALVCALLVAPVALIGFSGGCTTSEQRKTVNTIATLGYTVDASYKAYLDLIVRGKLKTNSVPAVARSYELFQSAFNSALVVAALNTNTPPSVELSKAAAQLQSSIQTAKQID